MIGWIKRAFARPTAARRFEAAQFSRLTASWMAGSTSLDEVLRSDLDALRARSRDLAKNNEYAAKFLRMVRNNVVGAQGFVLQCDARENDGKPDRAANAAIELAWLRQCRAGNFDVTGKRTGNDIWRTLAMGVARDGEYVLRIVRERGRGEFGFCVQVLDPARIDTSYNRSATPGQNAIVMGVELDAFRKPVAYHLLKFQAGNTATRERERFSADEIIHDFMPLEVEQTRGVPWMHAAMKLLRDLGGYREAAVIAARIGAAKMGVYVLDPDAPPPHDGVDDKGNFIQNAEPGKFDIAPRGYKLETYDPAYPHEQFDAFCKAALRGVSSAWGVAYPSLGNDLENVNFSSIRSGALEEREEWMVVQDWMISSVVRRVFEAWLPWALIGGHIKLPNGSALPAAKVDKFLSHTWQARRWAWVDPFKDMQASVMAISNLLASPQQIAAQTGRDVEDVLDDLQRFEQMRKERGIPAPVPATAKPSAKGGPAKADDDEVGSEPDD